MKKIIIICNTYFQVITSIQLKLKFYYNDEVILLISDHSKNTMRLFFRIKKLNIFSDVFYIKTFDNYMVRNKGILNRLFKFFTFINGNSYLPTKVTCNVDELLFFNVDLYTYSLFSTLCKSNSKVICKRFEEGLLSYNFPLIQGKIERLGNFIRKYFLLKPTLIDRMKDFFCYYPNLYYGNLNVIKIPKIDRDELKPIVEKLFDIDLSVYKYKYIFFTSVYDFDVPKPIGEIDVLRNIRKTVGNDNLLVKIHPRDRRDIFLKEGFHIDSNLCIPWEAILICAMVTNCVFLSVNSSCLFSSVLIDESQCVSAFVYPLCKVENDLNAVISVNNIESLIKNEFVNSHKRIKVIHSLDELLYL